MSTQPPVPGPPPGTPIHGPAIPPAGSMRCPRCSATVGPEQDWCLECGAPARTRLAPTPNWQLPTVALGTLVLIAGALFAFAFVKLTDDGDAPASAAPTAITTAAPVVPPVTGPTGPTGPTSATGATGPITPGADTPAPADDAGQTDTTPRTNTTPRRTTSTPSTRTTP